MVSVNRLISSFLPYANQMIQYIGNPQEAGIVTGIDLNKSELDIKFFKSI